MKRMAHSAWRIVIIFLLLLILPPTPHLLPPSYAQESSASAQESTTSGSLTGTIKEKLEEMKKEVASKAAALKGDINKKTQNKAFVGTVLDVNDLKITLETKNGVKYILINEYTTFQNSSKEKRNIRSTKDVLGSDTFAALGDVDDKGNLVAKKLIKVEPVASSSAKFVWGKIETVANPTIVIKNKEDKSITINTNSETSFILGEEEASILDAKSNRYMVAKGVEKQNELIAEFIYFIPSFGITKPEKKEASTSASPSPSPNKRP